MRHSIKQDPAETAVGLHDDDFHASFQHLVGEIFRINGTLLSVAERLARDLDITPARWQAIGVIQQQPLTASEIGRRLGIKRQSVQPTINRLLEQGLVRAKPNPGHRRAPLIELTAAGRRVWNELLRRQSQLSEEFTAGLKTSQTDLERLADALRELRRNAERNR